MKGIKRLLLVAASATAITMAVTATASVAIPTGWFAEGNLGYTKSSANYGAITSSTTPGLGWNINGGYKFMPYFAMEAGYTTFAKAKITSNGTTVARDTHNAYYVAGRGIFPISDSGFDFFAKLGISRIRSHIVINNPGYVTANGVNINSGTHAATGAYFGFGGDYNIWPNLAVNAQWDRAKGSSTTGNLDLYGVGLTYIFE